MKNFIKINVPSSKSQIMRALVFAALGSKKSVIKPILHSPDVDAMLSALKQIGCKIDKKVDIIEINGIGKEGIKAKNLKIDAKNSGLVLRFLGAILALYDVEYILDGDESIRSRRKIAPLVEGLKYLGAQYNYLKKEDFAPVKIKGPISSNQVSMCGMDSQPVSALLIASSFLDGVTNIFVKDPGEKPWVDLTLSWIKNLGGKIENFDYEKYTIKGGLQYDGFTYSVPKDFSSAAFPIAAALITQKHCLIEDLSFDDLQGDKRLIDVLIEMGAVLKKDYQNRCLVIYPSKMLTGGVFNVNDMIDAVPILAVIGCFCKNPLILKNCYIAKFKESDRLKAITSELSKMGALIKCDRDRLTIFPSKLHNAKVKSHFDHRIAMALCVASLKAEGKDFQIDNLDCINKSYPDFLKELKKFGE